MCGLVAGFGQLTGKKGLMSRLLEFDTARGKHSTGFAAIKPRSEGIELYKRTGNGYDFVADPEYDKLCTTDKVGWLGHNRYATAGSITAENAHPFLTKNLVGVHNGTLNNNYKNLLPDAEHFGTDSETIYNSIEEKGLDWTLERLHGDFALIWYDKRDHSLNVLRNIARPLHYSIEKDYKSLWISSDADIFDMAQFYARCSFVHETEAHSTYMQRFETDVHYHMELPRTAADRIPKKWKVCDKKDLIGSVHPTFFRRSSERKAYRAASNVSRLPLIPRNSSVPATVAKPAKESAKVFEPALGSNLRTLQDVARDKITELYMDRGRSSSRRMFSSEYQGFLKSSMPDTLARVGLMKKSLNNIQDEFDKLNAHNWNKLNVSAHHTLVGMLRGMEVLNDQLNKAPLLVADFENLKETEELNEQGLLASSGCGDLTKGEFLRLMTSQQCQNCHTSSDINTAPEEIHLIDNRSFVCDECYEIPFVKEHFASAFESQTVIKH